MGKILDSLIPDKVFDKLGTLAEKPINQAEKIEKLKKILREYKLKDYKSGTNRMIFRCKDYPTAVFKVALDEQGILDNLNEYEKSDKTHRFPSSLDIDEHGYVLVQKKWRLIESDEFEEKSIKKKVRECLRELEEDFVLIDLGMDKVNNFAYDENGIIGVIDFGYVTYKDFGNFNCPLARENHHNGKKNYCKGKLEYTKDYTMVQCTECGNVFRVDVLIEGHCEHKYQDTKPKKESFRVTSELQEFYESFNTYRDRESLTNYVKINTNLNNQNTVNEQGGNQKIMSSNLKDSFMKLSSKYENPVKEETVEKKQTGFIALDRKPEVTNVTKEKPSIVVENTTVETKESKIDIKKTFTSVMGNAIPSIINPQTQVDLPDDVDCIYPDEEEIPERDESSIRYFNQEDEQVTQLNEEIQEDQEELIEPDEEDDDETDIVEIRINSINRMLPDGEIGDEIISRLFYERFPELKDVVESSEKKQSPINMIEANHYVNFEVIESDGTDDPQVNINVDMNSALPNDRPYVIIHKDDLSISIDITSHLEYLVPDIENTLKENDDPDGVAIVTYMYGESFDKFDGNYESRYRDIEEE